MATTQVSPKGANEVNDDKNLFKVDGNENDAN